MDLFRDEFDGLPIPLQEALGQRLEEVVRMVYGRHNSSLRDHSINNFTKDEICGMIFAVFDLCQRLKNPLEGEDTSQE